MARPSCFRLLGCAARGCGRPSRPRQRTFFPGEPSRAQRCAKGAAGGQRSASEWVGRPKFAEQPGLAAEATMSIARSLLNSQGPLLPQRLRGSRLL
eukprot:5087526-Alexandrium_andersonii.AAC.1